MLKLLHSLVTVVLDPKPTVTVGGLVIPDTAPTTYRTGIVRATGIGTRMDNGKYSGLPIEPGDRVMIGAEKDRAGIAMNLGTIIDDDGKEVVLVNIQDIWGTCEKPAGHNSPRLAKA